MLTVFRGAEQGQPLSRMNFLFVCLFLEDNDSQIRFLMHFIEPDNGSNKHLSYCIIKGACFSTKKKTYNESVYIYIYIYI